MEIESKKRKERLEALRTARKKIDTIDTLELKVPNSENTVEAAVEGILTETISSVQEERNKDELDISKILQTKPDYDMKRILDAKLDILNFKTQASIIQLIKLRLESNPEQEDLSKAVGMHQYMQK
ncbi:hypothetical protein AYI70_g5617 [Smittium culicis]|uniref:Uncharacterized protein n=1 Tax=Smittium culicis TaxID=133412 RepID=A0A1R1XTY1_9FUNG|nr:hypothetical protein AYI70_g8736 [Smittium culicis]OMJ18009.1 hypothetical protein AYI70_g5617 [Smittium culicis]